MDILQAIHNQLDEYLEKASLLQPASLDTPFSKFGTVNVVAGPQDILLINAIVSERNTQISTLAFQMENVKGAIRKLVAIQAKLEENSAHLRRSLVGHQALMSPARRIPPEVLGEVFYHCLPKTPYITPSDVEAPLMLGRVCRRWRTVAMTTPRLWASLSVYLGKFTSTVYRRGCESWLARAKSVPLVVRVLNDINMRAMDPVLISSVVHWLRPLICQSTDLWWHGPSLPAVFVPEIGSDLLIQHLRVTSHCDTPSIHSLRPAKRLRTASFQCLNYDLQSLEGINLPWGTLVELNMHFALFSSTLFVELLVRCDHLHTLILSCLSADRDQHHTLRALASGSITHPRLRRLEIKVIRAGLDAIFDILTLPALEDLDICFCYRERDAWPHATFLGMLERSRCSLKRLAIRSNKNVVPFFGEYLKTMPGLTISTSTPDSLLQ